MQRTGTLLCLASGAAFGAMAIFGKLAYEEGATVGTLLPARFVIAATVFWLLAVATGKLRLVRDLPRRDVAMGLALGGIGYALQAGLFFAALDRVDASLLSLLLYTFPAMVAIAAVAIGRERLEPRRVVALILASGGLALVVGGAGSGTLDPLGAAFGIAAAATYATYILVSQSTAERVRPDVLATLVCTGAALSLTVGTVALGVAEPGAVSATGWGWIGGLAVISTVAAITLFFAGLSRVGPTAAGILSTVEPLTTVLLAYAVFGETLTALQLAGGALVLAAVPVLNVRLRGPAPATAPSRRRRGLVRTAAPAWAQRGRR